MNEPLLHGNCCLQDLNGGGGLGGGGELVCTLPSLEVSLARPERRRRNGGGASLVEHFLRWKFRLQDQTGRGVWVEMFFFFGRGYFPFALHANRGGNPPGKGGSIQATWHARRIEWGWKLEGVRSSTTAKMRSALCARAKGAYRGFSSTTLQEAGADLAHVIHCSVVFFVVSDCD